MGRLFWFPVKYKKFILFMDYFLARRDVSTMRYVSKCIPNNKADIPSKVIENNGADGF